MKSAASGSQALVSVIIPIYNVEKFLDQCLKSVENQTYSNLQIICINDGSTDSSPQIIRAHAAHDDRYVVVDKKNGGYGEGCNLGIDMAKGTWISIVEPDDWINPTMYEDMVTFAESFGTTIDIVKTPWTDIHRWNDPKKQKSYHSAMTGRIKTSTAPFTLADEPSLIEMHPSIWSAIYRRDFLNEKGIRFIPFPGAGWADNPFLIETMCQAQAIVYLDKEYYNYRIDLPGSTRNHKTADAITRPFERWLDMLGVLERLGVTDENVIKAHYVRGFNYVHGAIYDDGWDNKLVKEKTHEVFSKMRPELVDSMELAPHRRRFYCSVMGLPEPEGDKAGWRKHLVQQALYVLKHDGLWSVIKRIPRALHPSERSHV